jgi:hypothetical protein
MVIYCYVILALLLVGWGRAIGSDEEVGAATAALGLCLPLIGRILGWF